MPRKGLFIILILASFCTYSSSTLKIGTLYFNPPFEQVVQSSKQSFGFDIELINSLCKEMNKTCELIPLRFDKLVKALDAGQLDAIIVGISLMPENPDNYLFSYPYFVGDAVFLTLKANQLQSLDKKKIGIVRNTLFPVAKNYKLIFHENPPKDIEHSDTINMTFYDTLPELLTALDHHQVDAVILDAGVANYWINLNNAKYTMIGPSVHSKKGMAIMTTKDKNALVKEFNQAILALEKNNSLLAIYQRYWGAITAKNKLTGSLILQDSNTYNFVIPSEEEN